MAINNELASALRETFQEQFRTEPLVVRSPGRVNIIGEHTDYNNGFVLPAAIDKAIYVAISPRTDDTIVLYSSAYKDRFETSLSKLAPTDKGWPNYIMGVAAEMLKLKLPVHGFNMAIDGDIPIGSGLSSSAALECAAAMAIDETFRLGLTRSDFPAIAQRAEHAFAGVRVGIMDMFASVFGKKDHVIRLDCQSLDYEYVPFRLDGYKILLLNTNVKHSLNDSEYNTRRQQCEQGVSWVQEKHPEVKSLRDVNMEMLNALVAPRDKKIFARCKYVVEENIRLLEGCEDLKRGDLKSLGEKMFRTHNGLSKEYEVSCPELDFLVDAVRGNPAVPGARMMGGGFGGCTINLVKEEEIDNLIARIAPAYRKAMGKDLTPYIAGIENGTSILR